AGTGGGTGRTATPAAQTAGDGLPLPTPGEIERDSASVASDIDGAFAQPGHPVSTGEHGGAAIHDTDAQRPGGLEEISSPDPASQHTTDAQERPGAPSSAPTATEPEPAPGAGTHDRPELDTRGDANAELETRGDANAEFDTRGDAGEAPQ
ncbi:MAG: hypothetical protein GIX01_07815, partial [Candidatus Eremiobacteraeota bacterium]|nr:hypothetical protein [Candidatus Eremiobacteraeota bacterium]